MEASLELGREQDGTEHDHALKAFGGEHCTSPEAEGCAKQALGDVECINLHPLRSTRVSKYEYARLMCARVTALSRNATPAMNNFSPSEPGGLLQMAEMEFALGVLPFSLARRMPSGGEVVYPADKLCRVPSCTYPATSRSCGEDFSSQVKCRDVLR